MVRPNTDMNEKRSNNVIRDAMDNRQPYHINTYVIRAAMLSQITKSIMYASLVKFISYNLCSLFPYHQSMQFHQSCLHSHPSCHIDT